ncbi:hypothetical protein QOT17_020128 [Balamuthia mandrillaris]
MAETRPLDGTHCWYFAFGANMNPESLEKRQCYPLESWPAKLNDWAMRFNVNGMMGNIEPSPGSSVHGVAHHFTHETMERMIEIEGGKDQFYHVIEVEAELYDGRKVPSLAFVGTKETVKPGMGRPTERYIKLLIEGARHAGLDPQYIRFLEGVDYVKRRTPSRYLKLPPPILQKTKRNKKEAGREDEEGEENQGVQDEEECMREYTEQELKELHEEVNKADPLELAMAVAGWVIRVKLRGAGGWQTFLKLFGGKDSSFIMLQRLHDPTLPKVATPEEITEQHHAWLQDLIMGELGAAVYDLSTLQVLGKFVPSSSSSSFSSSTTTTTTTVNASCSSTTTTTTSTSTSYSPFGTASSATTTTTTTTSSSSHL